MMGEMVREHDQGFRARNSPLLQCLAAQTSPAVYISALSLQYMRRVAVITLTEFHHLLTLVTDSSVAGLELLSNVLLPVTGPTRGISPETDAF